jgi:hypothetical protein
MRVRIKAELKCDGEKLPRHIVSEDGEQRT